VPFLGQTFEGIRPKQNDKFEPYCTLLKDRKPGGFDPPPLQIKERVDGRVYMNGVYYYNQ